MKNIIYKFFFGFVVAAMSIAISAETPTGNYMLLRERVIDALHAQYSDQGSERLSKTANKLLYDAHRRLNELVGPVDINGFPSSGKSVLGTRGDDQYEGLDGIAMTSTDRKTQLFVTAVPIMQAWLAGHRKDVGEYSDLSKLVGTENFYNATSTISGDAAVYSYGEIPVTAKGGSVARAIVFSLGQDDPAPNPPNRLGVSVMSGDRIYVLTEAINSPKIPECKSLSQQTSISFEKCFAKKMTSQPEYSGLVHQAQMLVDRATHAQQERGREAPFFQKR